MVVVVVVVLARGWVLRVCAPVSLSRSLALWLMLLVVYWRQRGVTPALLRQRGWSVCLRARENRSSRRNRGLSARAGFFVGGRGREGGQSAARRGRGAYKGQTNESSRRVSRDRRGAERARGRERGGDGGDGGGGGSRRATAVGRRDRTRRAFSIVRLESAVVCLVSVLCVLRCIFMRCALGSPSSLSPFHHSPPAPPTPLALAPPPPAPPPSRESPKSERQSPLCCC